MVYGFRLSSDNSVWDEVAQGSGHVSHGEVIAVTNNARSLLYNSTSALYL